MSTQTTVAVTGATGFVGRHVTQALIDAGHSVRVLVRDPAKARAMLPREGVVWVQGDVNDARVAAELVVGARAVVNCIGIRREFPPEVTFERAHVRAVRSIVDAATRAGVSRIVHISALGTRPDAATAYHRTKFEAETILRKSGLRWTILRPSLIHGHDSEIMKMTKDWVLGRAAPWFVLPYFVRVEPPAPGVFPPKPRIESAKIQPVHIDDVAGAVVASLHNEESVGEIYPLGGPETIDWPTFLTSVRDALPLTEPNKRPAPLPGVMGYAMAKAAELIGMGAALPFGTSEPLMAIEDSTCSTEKARAQLGFRPRAFLSTVREYAGRV